MAPPDSAVRWIPSRRQGLALAVLAGVLYFLGFAGFEVWPFAFVSQVPFLLALRGRQGWSAFRLGWLTGTVFVGGGFFWIAGMLKTFSGFPLPLCVLLAAILWAAQGLQHGAFAWLVARADARGWPRLLTVPAALAATELAFPVLFPWYTANSLHRLPVLFQTADLGGTILVSMALALGWAALDDVLSRYLADRRGLRGQLRALRYPLAFWAFAIPYGLWRISAIDRDPGAPLRVGIVQQNLGLQEKRTDPNLALERHLEASRALERDGVDLIVWSESALAFRIPEGLENIRTYIPEWDLRTATLFGALRVEEPPGEHRRLFNTAFVTDATGRLRGRYDKVYLLAFGEYLPFGDWFPGLYDLSPNSGRFTRGSTLDALPIPGGHVAPLICYEDILPRFVSRFQREARPTPNILAVILNDAWFGDSAEPWIHDALAKFRAVEHRRDLLRAANSGVSSIIDAAGRETAHSGTFTRETVRGVAHLREGRTVYGVVGDLPAMVALAFSVAAAFRRRRQA
ncbi:MAG: apolipoprotein N-acyltransferase [Deltaproteobacteria bacterium]|nr:apolipoprotein N-acyltransferase [Deltaproteobacteria bacterium]